MTTTFNPIMGRVEIAAWNPLAVRPEPQPGVAVVLVRDGRPAHVIKPEDTHMSRGLRWSNYQAAYYVDISEHSLTFRCSLPCALPEHHFEAEVCVAYWASDPRMIVQRRITDAQAIVEPDVTRRMRAISRAYGLHECADAEDALQYELLKKQFLPEFTLTRVMVDLRMEEDERSHARRLRALERNHQYTMKHVEYRKDVSVSDIEHARLHLKFYNELLQSGYGQLLLLHMVNNGGEVQTVLQGLNQQLQLDRDHWLKMFNLLRDTDGVEGFQLEDLRNTVLKQLAESERRLPAGELKSQGAASPNGKEEPARDAKGASVPPVAAKQEPLKERAVNEAKTA
jgi:hypothetical protein